MRSSAARAYDRDVQLLLCMRCLLCMLRSYQCALTWSSCSTDEPSCLCFFLADRYCAIKVDALDAVRGLTYYGTEQVEPRNLGALVGLQQAALRVCTYVLHDGSILLSAYSREFEDRCSFFLAAFADCDVLHTHSLQLDSALSLRVSLFLLLSLVC